METIEGGYGYTIIERDETVCEREVRKVYKNAYVRRTIQVMLMRPMVLKTIKILENTNWKIYYYLPKIGKQIA